MSDQLFDYYYSAKQAAKLGYLCNKVRGQDYTEAVKAGLSPVSNYDDLVCVATSVSITECDFVKRPQSYTTGYQDPMHWFNYAMLICP